MKYPKWLNPLKWTLEDFVEIGLSLFLLVLIAVFLLCPGSILSIVINVLIWFLLGWNISKLLRKYGL